MEINIRRVCKKKRYNLYVCSDPVKIISVNLEGYDFVL